MKGHGGRPFGYVGFLRVLRLSPIRMDDRGAAVPFTYLKVAIYGAIFFWLICLISEHTLYKYLIPKILNWVNCLQNLMLLFFHTKFVWK